MSGLDYSLFSVAQMRQCEQQAQDLYNLDAHQLMLRAGKEAFAFIRKNAPHVRHIAVFCGSGNNAGDGYVIARLAHQQGLSVTIYQCKTPEQLPATAYKAAMEAQAAGIEHQSIDEPLDSDVELIIDALLGIGVKGPVHGVIAAAIEQINASGLPVVSLDVPSGLNADSGQVTNLAVQADLTYTFIGYKVGLYTLDGPDYCGAIYGHHLGLDSYLKTMSPYAHLVHAGMLPFPLPNRKKNSHKGDFGHVLVIGGALGMPGAVAMTAKAAMRVGAGLVTIATHSEHINAIVPLVPEAMIWGIDTPIELQPLLDKASFCILGPGLGSGDWAKSLFLTAISSQIPMLIDASGLRLLAEDQQLDDNWILTPHPGEAAALLATSSADIQTNRCEAAEQIQKNYGGVVVLKGVGTVIQTLERQRFICPKGNPGMASAGMGDVLSGIIAGLCAQGLSLSEAALLGVWVHASAADALVKTQGERGLNASDLLNKLPQIVNCIHDEQR